MSPNPHDPHDLTACPVPATAAGRLAAVTLAAVAVLVSAPAWSQSREALQAHHARLQPQLAASPFKRPLVLQSEASTSDPDGTVYAVLDRPYAEVVQAFRQPAGWCDVLLLQTNVKGCSVVGGGDAPALKVAIVRKHEQSIRDAFQVDFAYTMKAARADYLSVQMSAPQGPLGTRDYRLALEAVPLDGGRSFIRMSYAYANGVAARMATDAYLATSGRDKVGFSVSGKNEAGEPVYVGGMRGVAERNAMRYFLAIEAVLATESLSGDERRDKRLTTWFSGIERYPRQLKEMERADYLAMKKRELPKETAGTPAPAGGPGQG